MKRDVFQAIADPTRRDILQLLKNEPMTPNALAEHFNSSRQAVSKHIKMLFECELLQQEQSGREIYYRINSRKMKEIDKWLQPFRSLWDDRFQQLDNVLKTIKKINAMITSKETQYTVDAANKKIFVKRDFNASVEQVWKAWTEPAYLDQWWAPKPWKAITVSMDFQEGGSWSYYMEGPEGERHYCRADYEKIIHNRQYSGRDAFTDEKGNINTAFPRMHWDVRFTPDADGTKVNVEITFDSQEDLNKIVEMGFREGFAAAHTNLDALLAK